ncbi:hypothetical protein C8J56DRAFT_1058194 [Mycena floridula]|nr:hypothetical protein C8J56DRAFT_1058194 [Mycena floridula]
MQGGTVEEFRTLYWALYALPLKRSKRKPNANVPRFISLAAITHKYNFRTLERWALKHISWSSEKENFRLAEVAA